MKRILALLTLIVAAAACTPQEGGAVPGLNFTGFAPVSLDVAKIEVRDDYRPPMRAPNVDHLFRTPPDAAVRDLLARVLTPGGASNTLRAIVQDASVVDKKLKVTPGVLGTFSREPSDRYEAKVMLRFELFDPAAPDIVLGHAEVIARRSRTLMNSDSPADRDRAAAELTQDLMKDVEDGLQTVVKNTFGTK